jgi:hypothetical protein
MSIEDETIAGLRSERYSERILDKMATEEEQEESDHDPFDLEVDADRLYDEWKDRQIDRMLDGEIHNLRDE